MISQEFIDRIFSEEIISEIPETIILDFIKIIDGISLRIEFLTYGLVLTVILIFFILLSKIMR